MKSYTTFSFTILVGLVACSNVPYVEVDGNVCSLQISKIGCSNTVGDSQLEDLLISDRDVNSKHSLNWTNFPASISSLLCRCSRVAQEKGYIVFGIQYFGECWGSKKTLSSIIYNMKLSDDCRNVYFKACNTYDTPLCVGRSESIYLYTLISLPVDGYYSEWTTWSPCSNTCGEGVQERSRQCDNPKPMNGGKNCDHLGNSEETRICFNLALCNAAFSDKKISINTCKITKDKQFPSITTLSNPPTLATELCVILDTRRKWTPNKQTEMTSYTISSSLWNNKESSASFGLAYNAIDSHNYEFIYIRTVTANEINPFCAHTGKVIHDAIQWSGAVHCPFHLLSKQWVDLKIEVTSKLVTFKVNGQRLVVKRPFLSFQSIGGLVLKNPLNSEVFYQDIVIEQVTHKI